MKRYLHFRATIGFKKLNKFILCEHRDLLKPGAPKEKVPTSQGSSGCLQSALALPKWYKAVLVLFALWFRHV